ncbi:hypothetical protein ACWDKQ_07105 [Saccharopolyspora sp. NPDC000995]
MVREAAVGVVAVLAWTPAEYQLEAMWVAPEWRGNGVANPLATHRPEV